MGILGLSWALWVQSETRALQMLRFCSVQCCGYYLLHLGTLDVTTPVDLSHPRRGAVQYLTLPSTLKCGLRTPQLNCGFKYCAVILLFPRWGRPPVQLYLSLQDFLGRLYLFYQHGPFSFFTYTAPVCMNYNFSASSHSHLFPQILSGSCRARLDQQPPRRQSLFHRASYLSHQYVISFPGWLSKKSGRATRFSINLALLTASQVCQHN